MRILAILLLFAPSLSAATFTVSSSADSGPGTLRQAILDANATPGRDQIVFTVTSVTATTLLPAITDAVDINGLVGATRTTITTPTTICQAGLRFSAGSSGSTLTGVDIRGACYSVYIEAAVSNVTLTANTLFRVRIDGNDNIVGGTTAASGNAIARDVEITGARNFVGSNTLQSLTMPAALNVVQGNRFAESVPPAFTAIVVANTVIPLNGGTIAENVIEAYSTGVRVTGGLIAPTGVLITRNRIAGGVAIDLVSLGSPNDPPPDADTGPNNLQNSPVLTGAVAGVGQVVISGRLESAPLTSYRIELFATPTAAADVFLGDSTVTTDATGVATFSRTVSTPPAGHPFITATATNLTTNDTSELSERIGLSTAGLLGFTQTTYSVDEQDGSAIVTVQRAGGAADTVTVQYTTQNGTATATTDYQPTSGTLTFGPGVTSQTIGIPIVGDAVPEPAESFTVTLSNPTGGATLGTSTTTVTIAAQAATAAQIPTLSEWALLALALGLATVMFLRTR